MNIYKITSNTLYLNVFRNYTYTWIFCNFTENICVYNSNTMFACILHNTDTYTCEVSNTFVDDHKSGLSKAVTEMCNDQPRMRQQSAMSLDDPLEFENKEQSDELKQSTTDVPVYILSPVVNIVWMYLCQSWRDKLDFDFQRPANWNNDSQVLKFNHTKYVSMHNIWDYHDFALLANGLLLHKTMIVQSPRHVLWFISKIEYNIPTAIANANEYTDWSDAHDKKFWKPVTLLHYYNVIEYDTHFEINLQQDPSKHTLNVNDNFHSFDMQLMHKPVIDSRGQNIDLKPPLQHPLVAQNQPFFFSIIGFDQYHHTAFTGKHDWDTKGVYWWIGNADPHDQFSKQMTMIMAQSPECIPNEKLGELCNNHWIYMIKNGAMLWNGNRFITAKGMISHEIADMKERNAFMRRRGANPKSRCDGKLWLGYENNVKWPRNVSSLMQLNTITPGPYLLKLLHLKNNYLEPRGLWNAKYGKLLSLTTSKSDIYKNLPIASSLKCTTELNHTTVLGCVKDAFLIEWYNMHLPGNLDIKHTRMIMQSFLLKYFDKINGLQSLIALPKTKMNVFNQMHHAYQKLIEILMALPICVQWKYNTQVITALIRVTGALFNIKTENERLQLKARMIPILSES